MAQDHWLNNILHDGAVRKRNIARAKAFPPTGKTFVGFDFDQMRGAFVIKLLRIAQRLRHVILQNMAGDFGYFHWEAQLTFFLHL